LLREEGVPEDVLAKLEPLTVEPAMEFVSFRDMLRGALGGPSPHADRVAELSDYRAARAHANLAAAHLNLARLARAQRQLDLAAYHFAMTWAHTRAEGALQAWQTLQRERNLIPGGLGAEDAIRLYLRIPPPATAWHLPGPFDEGVLPASPLRAEGIRAQIRRAGGIASPPPQAESVAPVEVQVEPVPPGQRPGARQAPVPAVQPVPLDELPPPQDVPLEAPSRAKR
jgi:hypothetical protein